MMYGYGYGILGLIIGFVILLLLLGGLIWLIVWAVRRTSGGPAHYMGSSTAPQSAKEILQQRYAHGEITREQYLQMKRDLEE